MSSRVSATRIPPFLYLGANNMAFIRSQPHESATTSICLLYIEPRATFFPQSYYLDLQGVHTSIEPIFILESVVNHRFLSTCLIHLYFSIYLMKIFFQKLTQRLSHPALPIARVDIIVHSKVHIII